MLEEGHEEREGIHKLFLITAFVLIAVGCALYFLGMYSPNIEKASEEKVFADIDTVEPLTFVETEEGYQMKSLGGDHINLQRHKDGSLDLVLNSQDKNATLAVGIPFEDQVVSQVDAKSLLFESTTDGLAAEYGGRVEVSVYPKDPETIVEGDKVFVINENGGVEFDTILYAKPQTNTITFPIRSEGLGFYYQPPLTEEQEEGEVCSETQCLNEEGRATKTRPEHIVGSYAVYTLNADGSAGQKTYHVYRPKVFDAAGEEVWGMLSYEEGLLSVTVPQEFLEEATYPVTIDPTFGYTSIGGTSGYEQADYLTAGSFITPSDTSVATGVSLYFQLYDPGEQFKAVLLDSSCNIISSGVGVATDAPTPYAWAESTFATPPTLAPNTQYFIGMTFNGWPDYMYDTVPGHFNVRDTTNSFASPQNPTCTDANDKMISAFVTYDAATIPSNTPPVDPTVSGPTTGSSGDIFTFDMQSTDPDAQLIRYGVDWDMDGFTMQFIDGDDRLDRSADVTGDDSFVYLTNGEEGILSYSADSNGNITFLDSSYQGGMAYGVWTDGSFVYGAYSDFSSLAIPDGGIRTYSVDVSGNLTFIDTNDRGGQGARAVWGDGDFIYVAESFRGISSYSVDGAGNLTNIDYESISGSAPVDVWGDGDFIYVADYFGGIHSYSVDASGNLTHRDVEVPSVGRPSSIWGDGRFVYLAAELGVYVYSIDASGNFAQVDFESTPDGYTRGIYADTNYVYVGAGWDDGLIIYTSDQSGDLRYMTSFDKTGEEENTWVRDDGIIFHANGNAGLNTYRLDLGVDEWVPLTGSVPSGTLQSVNHEWSTAGVKTFQVLTQDGFGANSLYVPHTITLTNTAPTVPTVSGPAVGETYTTYSFTFLSDDGTDLIRYGIDWDMNGTVDEWAPASGYGSSSVLYAYKKSWTTTGSKTFQVLAEDDEGLQSGWEQHAITMTPTSKNILFYDGGEDWSHNSTCGSGHPWDSCVYGDGYVRSVNDVIQSPAVGGWYISAWDLDTPDTGTIYLTANFDSTVCSDLTLDFYVSAGTSLEDSPNEAARLEVFNGSVWNQEYISDDPLIAGSEDEDGLWHQYSIDISGYINTNTGIRLLGRPTNSISVGDEWHAWDEIKVWCSGTNTVAPTTPDVSGATQGEVNSDLTFSFETSDPNGDNVRYGVDWDNDEDVQVATGDEWLPASGYGVDDPFNWNAQFVNSGVSQSTTTSWSTVGPKNFRVFGQDNNGNFSVWTPHTIYIGSHPSVAGISGTTTGSIGTSYDFNLTTTDLAGGDSDGIHLSNVKEFGVGLYHSCSVTYSGEMYCWGQAGSGYLGNGQTSGYYPTPVRVLAGVATGDDTDGTYLVNVRDIAVGDVHTCATTYSNNTYCWGDSMSGRLGDGQDATDRSTPVKVLAGAASGGDSDGTYLINVRDIAGGGTQTCVVTNNDRSYCWGSATAGQLGDGQNTTNRLSPVRVLEGEAIGDDTDGTYLINVKSIVAGGMHTCAITNNGNAYCWGNTLLGRLGNGATTGSYFSPSRVLDGAATGADSDGTYLVNVKDISGGGGHSCATTNSGNAYCWGWSGYGQLGDGQTATDIPTPVRVQDGAATGADTDGTYLVNVRDVAAGGFYSCAVSNSGNTYCWGGSAESQLGDGQSVTNSSIPKRVLEGEATGDDTDGTYLVGIVDIVSRRDHACAVSNSRNLYCWGAGDRGQLGDGQTATNQSTPVKVLDGQAVSTIVHDQVKYGIDWDRDGGTLAEAFSYVSGTYSINVWGDGGEDLYVAAGDRFLVYKKGVGGTFSLVYPPFGYGSNGWTNTGIWGDGRYVYTSSIKGTGPTSEGRIRSWYIDSYGYNRIIDEFAYGSGAWGLEVSGDDRFVYLANGGDGIRSFIVDEYGYFTEAGHDTTSGKADDIWTDDNFVYLGDLDGFIYIYSVDPATGAFTLENTYNSGSDDVDSLWGDGTYLYAAVGHDGIQVLSPNITTGALTLIDAHNPRQNFSDSDDYSDSIWGDGRFIFVGNKSGGIHSYLVNQSGYLTHMDSQNPGGFAYGMWSDGDYVYLANNDLGLRSYAVTDGVDDWFPSSGYTSANAVEVVSRIWSAGGSQTFQVTVEDDSGGYSPWAWHTINLGFPDISGSRGNVTGRAWSNKLGEYVSFDCGDSVGGDTCATLPYGVNIQGTPIAGDFEGHAFNESVGWIVFNELDLGTCGPVGNLATDDTVSGYARVMFAATESCMNLEGTPPNDPVTYDSASGEFQGWAWGGDLLGWVSFNSLTCDADEDGLSDGTASPMSLTKTKIITDDLSPEAADPEVDEAVTYLDSPNDLYIKDGYAYVVSDDENAFSIYDITTDPSRPALVGTLRDGDVQGSATHADKVNENLPTPPNSCSNDNGTGLCLDETNYVETTSQTIQYDVYNVEDPAPGQTGTINLVSVGVRKYGCSEGWIVFGGSDVPVDGYGGSPNCSWSWVSGPWYGSDLMSVTRPGGGAWTWADIADIQLRIGLKNDASHSYARIGLTYLEVEYDGGSIVRYFPESDVSIGIESVTPDTGGSVTVDGLAGAIDVAVSGNYAYVSGMGEDAFAVIDVSDKANPQYVTHLQDAEAQSNPGGPHALYGPQDIEIYGNYAYVASVQDHAISIINISDPANPVEVGVLVDDDSAAGGGNTGGIGTVVRGLRGVDDIDIEGGYLYANGYDDGTISIFNLNASPTSPPLVAMIADNSSAEKAFADLEVNHLDGPEDVEVEGNYMYVAATNGPTHSADAVSIFDITDRANPVIVSVLADDDGDVQVSSNGEPIIPAVAIETPEDFAVVGTNLYITSAWDDALSLYDVSSTTNPQLVFTIADDDNASVSSVNYTDGGDNKVATMDLGEEVEVVGEYIYSLANLDDAFNTFRYVPAGGGAQGCPPLGVAMEDYAVLYNPAEINIAPEVPVITGATVGTPDTEYTFNFYALDLQHTAFSGLVAGYRMDEGFGTQLTDRSSYENDGNFNGSISWTTSGKSGSGAVSFDGSPTGYVTVPDDPSLALTDAVSLEAWVYLNNTSMGDYATIAARQTETGGVVGGYLLGAYFNGPNSNDIIFGVTRSEGADLIAWPPSSNITSNAWHHIVGTFDNTGGLGDMHLYIDGVEVDGGQAPGWGSMGPISRNFYIGGDPLNNSAAPLEFNGIIDEVHVYNRALTPVEVALLWNENLYDQVKYGIDWSDPLDGVVDEWVPDSGYVSGGTSQSTTTTWTVPAVHIFRILAEDDGGMQSAWAEHQINITSGTLPTINLSATPAEVTTGDSSTLLWSTVDADSCAASASPANTNWSGDINSIGTGDIANGSAPTGSLSGSVGSTFTFTLECTNLNGTHATSTIVTIKDTECSDGDNNDGEDGIDADDPACRDINGVWHPEYNDESANPQCSDGIDNDGDGLNNFGPDPLVNDPGCVDIYDNDENNCGDNICDPGETFGTCPGDCPFNFIVE